MRQKNEFIKSGGFGHHIHPLAARKIFTALLTPISDYALHLVHSRGSYRSAFDTAIGQLADYEYTALRTPHHLKSVAARTRMFNIYSLLSCRQRRKMLAQKTYNRLRAAKIMYQQEGEVDLAELKRIEIQGLKSLHFTATFTTPMDMYLRTRVKIENRKERKICCHKVEPHPAMMIKSVSLSRHFIRYHMGRFITPRDKNNLEAEYGLNGAMRIRNKMRWFMQQPELTEENKGLLLNTMKQITELWAHDHQVYTENPWRKLNSNLDEQLRNEITLTEAIEEH